LLRAAFALLLVSSIEVHSADAKPAPAADSTNAPPATGEAAATTAQAVLKLRAERGDVNAQYALGMEHVRAFEYREAIKWHVRAAERGHARAQHMMGVRYVFGQGVARDREEAALWFAKAAAQGEPNSQFSLGLRCVLGDSVPQDFEMAARWFKLAADQGHSEAQRSLGRRYAAGEGVKKDLVEALKWYLVAAANGDGESKSLSEKLTPTMTPVQIAEGMIGAAGFVPKPRF
jgi:TPR repeat protein